MSNLLMTRVRSLSDFANDTTSFLCSPRRSYIFTTDRYHHDSISLCHVSPFLYVRTPPAFLHLSVPRTFLCPFSGYFLPPFRCTFPFPSSCLVFMIPMSISATYLNDDRLNSRIFYDRTNHASTHIFLDICMRNDLIRLGHP